MLCVHTGLVKAHVPGSSRTSGFNFPALRKGLKLVVNEPDQMSDTPADVAYLYKVRRRVGCVQVCVG